MESVKTNITGYVGSTITIFSGVVGLEYGLNITLLIVGIISGVLALCRTIYVWYKDAKKDGKITADEIVDLGDKINKHAEDLSETIKGVQDGEDKRD